jgi:hypothetical protein
VRERKRSQLHVLPTKMQSNFPIIKGTIVSKIELHPQRVESKPDSNRYYLASRSYCAF